MHPWGEGASALCIKYHAQGGWQTGTGMCLSPGGGGQGCRGVQRAAHHRFGGDPGTQNCLTPEGVVVAIPSEGEQSERVGGPLPLPHHLTPVARGLTQRSLSHHVTTQDWGGGGLCMTPGCIAVCSWWRLSASRH